MVAIALLLAASMAADSKGRAMAQDVPLDPGSLGPDVRLAIEVRPGAMLKHPEFRKLAAQIPADLPKLVGLITSGEMERVIILVFERDEGRRPPSSAIPRQMAFHFRSSRAQDWKACMPRGATEVEEGGITYFRAGSTPDAPCFRVLDDRTFLVGTEADVKSPPFGGRPEARHPWDDAWRKLPPGVIRAAFDARWLARRFEDAGLDRTRPGPFAPVASFAGPLLGRAQAHAIRIGVADGLTIEGLATCDDDDGARRVADTLRAYLTLARNAATDLRRPSAGAGPGYYKPAADLLDALDAMLGMARVEQDRSVVRLHAQADPAAVALAAKEFVPGLLASTEAVHRAQCINNLKRIGLAMFDYRKAHGSFPTAVLLGPDGKTPHGWRVALLPYLDADDLSSRYKLDEPWDGPNNRQVLAMMPEVYRCPDDGEAPSSNFTSYFATTGPEAAFPGGKKGMEPRDFTDGSSNTFLVVEAKREVPWTKPEDIPYARDRPVPATGGFHPGGFEALMADGAVHFIKHALDSAVLRALFTREALDSVPGDAYR